SRNASQRSASRERIASLISSSIVSILLTFWSRHPSDAAAAEDVPVQMEDRLPGPGAHVDDDTVVGQALARSDVGDEVEHPLRLVGGKLPDLAKARDVTLGQHEQMRRRL